jgi:hypothetical protein
MHSSEYSEGQGSSFNDVALPHGFSVSHNTEKSARDNEEREREYLRLRGGVWYDVIKPHNGECECKLCREAYEKFRNWSMPGPHPKDCDCDFCLPAFSFCTCTECIPDIMAFDLQGDLPLCCPPHSRFCTCGICPQTSTYDAEAQWGTGGWVDDQRDSNGLGGDVSW